MNTFLYVCHHQRSQPDWHAIGPDLAFCGVILHRMRVSAQMVLHDATLRKPSGFGDYLAEFKKSESVSGYHHVPAREPKLVDLPETLETSVREALEARGIRQLYSHQAEA